MQYYPGHPAKPMPQSAQELLATLRERRNFSAEAYLEAKAKVLNDYMRRYKLKSCTIAISGGIDSAVVAAIVAHAKKQPGSPIENIVAVTLPVHRDNFTKNQLGTVSKARTLGEALGIEVIEIDLTNMHSDLLETVGNALDVTPNDWAGGQGVALARTAPLYLITNLEKQLGRPSILCGTTNRDEGAYLGYVGKASDGMVDVQLISDLHKSEVRAVARHAGVPQEILDAAPTGDMYDGREDEALFGASYDYVELLLLLKSLPEEMAEKYLSDLSDEDRASVQEAFDNLEDLHAFNGHKYEVGSPARHLDIMESGVRGGWTFSRNIIERTPRGAEHFVNAFDLSDNTLDSIREATRKRVRSRQENIPLPKGEAMVLDGVLDKRIIDKILRDADTHGWIPANTYGDTKTYVEGEPVGSLRASVFSPELADLLWARISPNIPAHRIMGQDPQIEVPSDSIWRPVGVSPLCRLISYEEGGALVPHYDESFLYTDPTPLQTLKSVVVYLDANAIEGGATRFIEDDRLGIRVRERDLTDRDEFATSDDVIVQVEPEVGSALVFDHVLLHDSEGVQQVEPNGRKVIMRTDLVYQRC